MYGNGRVLLLNDGMLGVDVRQFVIKAREVVQ